ncbi:MAG: hypothetical protein ACPLX8_01820, partial [Nanopusillaceae archaeon]
MSKSRSFFFIPFIYYFVIFIIILAGVLFILLSIFKYKYPLFSNVETSQALSEQNQNNNNINSGQKSNITVIVETFGQFDNKVFYIQKLSDSIYYYINSTVVSAPTTNLVAPNPSLIYNNTPNIYQITALQGLTLNISIVLTNNTDNSTIVTFNGGYCKVMNSQNYNVINVQN